MIAVEGCTQLFARQRCTRRVRYVSATALPSASLRSRLRDASGCALSSLSPP